MALAPQSVCCPIRLRIRLEATTDSLITFGVHTDANSRDPNEFDVWLRIYTASGTRREHIRADKSMSVCDFKAAIGTMFAPANTNWIWRCELECIDVPLDIPRRASDSLAALYSDYKALCDRRFRWHHIAPPMRLEVIFHVLGSPGIDSQVDRLIATSFLIFMPGYTSTYTVQMSMQADTTLAACKSYWEAQYAGLCATLYVGGWPADLTNSVGHSARLEDGSSQWSSHLLLHRTSILRRNVPLHGFDTRS